MYDAESLRLFGAVKAICDPDNLLNPGNLVDPAPLDADLRPVRPRLPITPALRFVHDGGALGDAVHRCTGVGKCVAPRTNGVMCPSYLATRDEKDSTRGRSRVLQEALDGDAGRRARRPGGRARRSTSAWPARAARPTARPASTWRPTRPRRCTRSTTAGATCAARAATTCSAGCRSGPRWPRRWRRWPTGCCGSAPVAAAGQGRAPASTSAARSRRSRRPRCAAVARDRATAGAAHGAAPDVWIWADSFTDHFLPQTGARRDPAASRRPA